MRTDEAMAVEDLHADLLAEIDHLRAGLHAIIVADQIAGAAPPHVTLRRLPEFNVETWDGPHAALARRVLEQSKRSE